ncbi:CHAD domain-containing protein [Streptomyces boninensis]|uniref:CYTH and CHAD domain-containing protein n=1 Tax=Streptomyces boninensis TaxID=2039455 RepID=UPI003B210501
MADTVREIERKYEFTATPDGHDERLPDLTGVPGVEAVVDKGADALDATYYDTAARRLAADGITLRRRTGGDDAGWHLKLPVAPGVRDEIRAPLAEQVPARLTALVRSRVRDSALNPLVRIESRRTVWQLLGAEGVPLADASIDRVTAKRLTDGELRAASWTEVEVELAEGQEPALLDAVEARLIEGGLRPSDAPSKLARALAETEFAPKKKGKGGGKSAGGKEAAKGKKSTKGKKSAKGKKPATKPTEPPPPPPPTAADHILDYLRAQVTAIVELDPAVRRDLPDSVHRMRVATRRLRSAFRSYRKILDRAATDPVGEELKWLAAELGIDRDREVLTARIQAGLDGLPRTLTAGPVRGRLRTWSAARRQGSRRRLVAVLDGKRYLTLLDTLDALLADPPLKPAAAKPPEAVIPDVVRRDYERLAAYVADALDRPSSPETDLAMHEARKAAKRTRYAAEAARAAVGKPAKRFAARMTEVQELLGDHQDSVVVREALRDLAAQAAAAGENAFTFGLLYGREEARAEACERELPELWERVSEPGLRAELG